MYVWVRDHQKLVDFFENNGAGSAIFGSTGKDAVNADCDKHGYRLKS